MEKGPPRDDEGRIVLRMSPDYGLAWPLSDAMWPSAWGRVDWDAEIGPELVERLRSWARSFTDHADEESGEFRAPMTREAFDARGRELAEALRARIGERYRVDLELWF